MIRSPETVSKNANCKCTLFLVLVLITTLVLTGLLDEVSLLTNLLMRKSVNGSGRVEENPVVLHPEQPAKPLNASNRGIVKGEVKSLIKRLENTQQEKEEKQQQADPTKPVISESLLASRLPKRPLSRSRDPDERILVVYSGPTDLLPPNVKIARQNKDMQKAELYRLNFEYFLKHGIQCKTQDTILVVTEVVAEKYRAQIQSIDAGCRENHGNQVILAMRNKTCLDLESVRVALYGNHVNVSTYDYLIYINCGVTGPASEWATLPWTDVFVSRLDNEIRMTGLSMNCGVGRPHIQSMMYALDRTGVKLVMDGGAIFDCRHKVRDYESASKRDIQHEVVTGYEIGMSELVLDAGYGIAPLLRPRSIFSSNRTDCRENGDYQRDLWLTSRLEAHFGKIPSLSEVIFFKTSRVLSAETAQLINYTHVRHFNW